MFNDDKPIENSKNDILGRSKFVFNISKAIVNWKKTSPLVISLCGPWGSGKTSILNMIKEEISQNNETKEGYVVLEFNPWAYSNQDNILDNFLDEFALQVKGENKESLYKEILKYKRSLSYIPDFNQIHSIINSILIVLISLNILFINQKINNYIFPGIVIIYIILNIVLPIRQIRLKVSSKIKTIEYNLLSKSPKEMKKKISVEIEKTEKKYIIIIDDIDRLDKEEIQQLFKMVRNNIDFPNTIFILSFDREIVSNSLCIQEGVSGDRYLEKIIQVDFSLPTIKASLLHKYFANLFNASFEKLRLNTNKLVNNKLLKNQNIIENGILPFIKNIRDAKRLINSFEFYLGESNNKGVLELNPIDLLGIETIRLFEFQYYNYIKNNYSLFLGSIVPTFDAEEENKGALELFNNSFKDIPINNKKELEQLLNLLFPHINSITKTSSNYNISKDDSELRISNSLFFKSYFNYVPGGDDNNVCEFDLMSISISSADYNSFTKNIENLKALNKYDSLLTRLQTYSEFEYFFVIEKFETIILGLFDSLSDISYKEYQIAFFQQPVYKKLVNIISTLLSRTNDLEKNYCLIKTTIKKSTSIFCLTYFINEIDEKNSTSKIIDEVSLSNLKQEIVIKIDEYNLHLLDDKAMNFILLKWKEWGDSKKYQELIKLVNSNDDLFVKFIDHYAITKKGYSFSTSINDFEEIFFDLNNIDVHIPVKEIDKKIKYLYNNSKYNQYKHTFDLFIRDFNKMENNS